MGMHTIWSRYLPEINITPIVIVTQQNYQKEIYSGSQSSLEK